MDIFIDNKNLKTEYGITVLDYTKALGFAASRTDEIEWADKSGVDPNLENSKLDTKEFVFKCLIEADSEIEAYTLVKVLIDYMLEKRVFILSLRDAARNTRESMICERSSTIVPDINIRQQNSLYVFKIGFKDINPNALRYQTEIIGNEVTINYDKGVAAILYWGDGSRGQVTNSGNYTKNDYVYDGLVDVFVDVDKNISVNTPLVADFVGVPLSGLSELSVQFTDNSVGAPILWAWNFGDGEGSSEQNPLHTYKNVGVYTVTLQVFNAVGGNNTVIKTDYITVTLPDFDSNINSNELSAIVSQPFTFSLLPDPSDSSILGQNIDVVLSLNGVETTFNILAGQSINQISIVKDYTEITADSYFKVTTRFVINGYKTNPSALFQKGSLIMQDAGVKRLRMYDENPPSVRPYNILLDGNNIPENDINILLETFAATVDAGLPQGGVEFDISGGTNAVPTSPGALDVKNDLVTNPYQIYRDNS